MLKIAILAACVLLNTNHSSIASELIAIQKKIHSPIRQTVEFHITKNTKYKVTQLHNSHIVRVEVESSPHVEKKLESIISKLKQLPSILHATIAAHSSFIVIEIKLQQQAWLASVTHDVGKFILTTGLSKKASILPSQLPVPIKPKPRPQPSAKPNLVIKKNLNKKRQKMVIVIDAGHGGRDPGAIGKLYKEKHINLRAALLLKKKLSALPEVQVYMTRSSDRYVTLQRRVEFAKKKQAGLFLSLHSDASSTNKAKGASIYALSIVAASKKSNQLLNSKGNPVLGYGKITLKDYSRDLAKTLLDLSQRSFYYSTQIGIQLVPSLVTVTHMNSKKIKNASFQVLKSFDFPSLLIEMGFISNRNDEKNLGSSKWLNDFTSSIVKGLKAYFKKNPNFIHLYAS